MDRNGESIFTSNFWREINEQFFMVHSLVNVSDLSLFKKKFSNYVNLNCHKLLDKILKQNNRSKLSQLNFINLKQKLSLLLQQRKHHQEPIQNLIDEMIDQICYAQLIEGLQQTEDLIKNMSQKSEQQQQIIYHQENQILTNLHHMIDSKDELSKQIQQLEQQLEQLDNSNSLLHLEQHVQEINNTLLYIYSSQIVKEHSIKLTRSRVRSHQEELRLLKDLIILHEDYQVAESIGKAIFNEQSNTITVIFDTLQRGEFCLFIHTFNVTKSEFQLIPLLISTWNILQIFKSQEKCHMNFLNKYLDSDLMYIEQFQLIYDVFEMQMCHSCKLMVDVKNLKQCSYNHFQMGLHEYNEDLLTCQRYQINAKSQQQYILDLYSTNYIIENLQIHCKRYFCLKCLKHEFDSYEITQFQWICPLCKGQCTCIRCSRNEVIYKLKRQYLELNGDLEDIYQSSYFEMLVKEKRNLIKNIPIDFIIIDQSNEICYQNILTSNQQKYILNSYNMFNNKLENNEDTVIPKGNLKHKKSITKNMLKKKIKENDTQLTSKSHKLTHIESSSSSIKIKKSKEIKKRSLYFTNNHNDHSNQQIFIQ